MVSWSRSQRNEPRDVEEEYIGDRQEIDADVEAEEDHDGTFVTGPGHTRGYPIAKILSFTIFALVFAGTAFGTGYGISSAVGRSGISQGAVGADEQTLVDSYSPTSYMPTYMPTYAPSAAEKAVVTKPPAPKPTSETTEVTVEEATEPAGIPVDLYLSMPLLDEEAMSMMILEDVVSMSVSVSYTGTKASKGPKGPKASKGPKGPKASKGPKAPKK